MNAHQGKVQSAEANIEEFERQSSLRELASTSGGEFREGTLAGAGLARGIDQVPRLP